jgi:hypothetical protein
MYHLREATSQGADKVSDSCQKLQGVSNQYEALIDYGMKQLTNNHQYMSRPIMANGSSYDFLESRARLADSLNELRLPGRDFSKNLSGVVSPVE